MTQDGVFSVRGTAAPDPSPQGGSSIRSCRAAGPRVSEGCLEPLGKQPGAAWPPGACAALPEEGPPCRGPSGTTVFMAGLGVAWLLCKPGFICLSPVGQAACVPGSGLSHPRLLAFCLEPKTVPLLLARPEVVLRAPGSCGIAWGLLGLGRDWGRPRHPCPPGPPGHRLWLQVSCPLAAGPHVLFLPLSGLANHGQTRHMVRGRASGTSPPHVCPGRAVMHGSLGGWGGGRARVPPAVFWSTAWGEGCSAQSPGCPPHAAPCHRDQAGTFCSMGSPTPPKCA